MPPLSAHTTGGKRRVRQGSSLLGLSGKSPLISTTCRLFIFSYTLSIPAWVCLDSSLSSRLPVQPSASVSQRSPPSYLCEPVQLAQHDPSCGRGVPPEHPHDWAHHLSSLVPAHIIYTILSTHQTPTVPRAQWRHRLVLHLTCGGASGFSPYHPGHQPNPVPPHPSDCCML